MKILAGFLKIVLLVGLTAFSSSHAGVDLGKIGVVYPITEKDLVELIKERLAERMESGEVAKLHDDLKDKSKSYAARPPGTDLPQVEVYRAKAFDPSFVLENDIRDANGRLIYSAGTLVNPLNHKVWGRAWCFIDGDSEDQVNWAVDFCGDDLKSKRILVKGDVLKVMESTGKRFYFDQGKVLIDHFKLKAVPSVIRQSGRVLYVEEFPVN